jgi:hypothetical protein
MDDLEPQPDTFSADRTARRILAVFLLTFLSARVLVLLIMLRITPDLFLHMGGTHVHHLNYGIFLMSAVAGYLLIMRPTGRRFLAATYVYAFALALTFDEFGMWLHLGGSYWQRASFDAIVVIASVLGLIAVAPALGRFRPRHWYIAAAAGLMVMLFAVLLVLSLQRAEQRLIPELERIQERGPG